MNSYIQNNPEDGSIFPWEKEKITPKKPEVIDYFKDRTYSTLETKLSHIKNNDVDIEPILSNLTNTSQSQRAEIREIIRNMNYHKKFFTEKGIGFSRMTLAYNSFVSKNGLELEKILLEDTYFEALSTCIVHMTKPGRLHFTLLKKLSGIYKKMLDSERQIFQNALHHIIFLLAKEIHHTHPNMRLDEIFNTWKIRYLQEYFLIPDIILHNIKQDIIDRLGLKYFP